MWALRAILTLTHSVLIHDKSQVSTLAGLQQQTDVITAFHIFRYRLDVHSNGLFTDLPRPMYHGNSVKVTPSNFTLLSIKRFGSESLNLCPVDRTLLCMDVNQPHLPRQIFVKNHA